MEKSFNKQAVDQNAEQYWEDYYKDSGYGELWVREIPKRIKAALKQASPKKTASIVQAMTISPLSTIITEGSDGGYVLLEGLAQYGKGSDRVIKAFVATFGHEGNLTDFDFVDVQ